MTFGTLKNGPSVSGAFCMARSRGRPVVTTASRSTADLGDLSGLPQLQLVPTGDVDALATTIESALVWSGQTAPLPAAFRWQSIATAHAALYRRVVDEHRR